LIGKASQERDNSPSTSRVKTRGGLVEEKQEFGLGGEFDGDGGTLAVFNVEGTDNGFGVLLKPTHGDAFFNTEGLLSTIEGFKESRTYYASFSAKGTEGG
jgi:hypothetical protein